MANESGQANDAEARTPRSAPFRFQVSSLRPPSSALIPFFAPDPPLENAAAKVAAGRIQAGSYLTFMDQTPSSERMRLLAMVFYFSASAFSASNDIFTKSKAVPVVFRLGEPPPSDDLPNSF